APPPLPAPSAPQAPSPAVVAPTPAPVVTDAPTQVPGATPAPVVIADAPPPYVPEKRPGESANDIRFTDAHADRVVLGSTAETHPQGTFFFSDYEVILLQFGYAVTDSLQLSVAGLPPLAKEQPYFFDFGLKLNVARTDVFRAALLGAFDV